jgi:hypothetical protein
MELHNQATAPRKIVVVIVQSVLTWLSTPDGYSAPQSNGFPPTEGSVPVYAQGYVAGSNGVELNQDVFANPINYVPPQAGIEGSAPPSFGLLTPDGYSVPQSNGFPAVVEQPGFSSIGEAAFQEDQAQAGAWKEAGQALYSMATVTPFASIGPCACPAGRRA